MAVMQAVWPLTGLYFGPAAVLAYRRLGTHAIARQEIRHPSSGRRWSGIGLSVTHCGAGCALGDIIAEFALFALALTIAGRALFAEYICDYVLAIGFGIVFQYVVISRMRRLTLRSGLIAAAKSDVVALSAFEIGLFGWMALMRFVFFPSSPLRPDSAVYWMSCSSA
jgi:hypothetical protein